MLVRASRIAEQLTKEALLGRMALKAGSTVGKGILNQAGKHWKGVAGTGIVGASVLPEISQKVQQSKIGLQPGYLQAANAGLVPSMPAV